MPLSELGSGDDPPALRLPGGHLGLWECLPFWWPFTDTTAGQGNMASLGVGE